MNLQGGIFSLRKMSTIIFLVLLVPLVACYVIFAPFLSTDGIQYKYPSSTGAFKNHGDYKINSATIIASLDHGDTDLFMPELATPDTDFPSSGVLWYQSDFLKVVNALNQHVWHDTLTNWNVYEVLLNTSCENNLKGFEGGRLTFFKTVWMGTSLYYSGRSMTLAPQDDIVSWGGGTNFPHPILGWKGYGLSKFKITADDALQIAEENGGKEFRSDYKDQCNILVYIIGDVGWEVAYSRGNSNFIIDIDPYTGVFKVPRAVK